MSKSNNQTHRPNIQKLLEMIKELELAINNGPELSPKEKEILEFALADLIKNINQ